MKRIDCDSNLRPLGCRSDALTTTPSGHTIIIIIIVIIIIRFTIARQSVVAVSDTGTHCWRCSTRGLSTFCGRTCTASVTVSLKDLVTSTSDRIMYASLSSSSAAAAFVLLLGRLRRVDLITWVRCPLSVRPYVCPSTKSFSGSDEI